MHGNISGPERPRYQKYWLGIVLTLIAGSCGSESVERPAAAKDNQIQEIDVDFVPAKEMRIPREITTTGTLTAFETVTVSSEVASRVEKTYYDVGDFVQRGRTLVELDRRETGLQMERARAALEESLALLGTAPGKPLPAVEEVTTVRQARSLLDEAQRRLRRAEELLEKGVISQAQLDEVRTNYEVSEARYGDAVSQVRNLLASVRNFQAALKLAEDSLADTIIRAPISGFVDRRHVSEGEYIRDKDPVITLVQSEKLKLLAQVPEREAGVIKPGVKVVLNVDAFPGRDFTAEIRRVSPTVDEKNRSFEFSATVPNSRGLLKPGFFARCRILVGEQTILTVPAQAVFSFAGVKKVFARVSDHVEERPVEIGIEVNGSFEVLSGVRVGEEVAVSHLSELSNDQRVK
ncbi:MAG: efflux RND transporter periplasmic adaptor subunit [Acidobacteria bacterium]|nr:efflux RND transporter periplasmic adaptor subunit [Acidobacteriota bacterium]